MPPATKPNPDPPQQGDEPTFTTAELRTPGRGDVALGFLLPDIAGAFHGEPDDSAFTVSAAQKRVREWLKSPVDQHDKA